MNLFIVESPGKVKKIQSFLGNGYKVKASVGHIRDLPLKELGVSISDYTPQYVPTERGKNVIKDLKILAKDAENVFLATDPDREGEAIAWHLKEALGLKNPLRVTYTEITESAIKVALQNTREIDYNLVKAQEARRVLDRLVGYTVSPGLSQVIGEFLSAGRVQSPALRLVVEREESIKNFKMTTHFGIEFVFDSLDTVLNGWKAQWNPKLGWLPAGEDYFLDKEVAAEIAKIKTLEVVEFEEKNSKTSPPAAFTTSSLQQAASNSLKFSPKTTMEVAQKLYEQGHITYMRTDSPNLSEEAIVDIRSLASQNDWPVPPMPRTWKSKSGAQEAHEAVRPTHFEIETAGETESEQALYKLIRIRAIASQLEDAVYTVIKAKLEGECNDIKCFFEARGRRLLSAGWRVLSPNGDQTEEKEDDAQLDNPIPKLEIGKQCFVRESSVLTKKTKPPARFTEASLIKELENRGIGRPSTYAAILSNIMGRKYIELEKRQLKTTELGEKMINELRDRFSFVNYEFTKTLEADLDEIAEGKKTYLNIVKPVDEQLQVELRQFITDSGHVCPECGKLLVRRVKKASKDHKGYDFWACTGYPECKVTLENNNGQPGKQIIKKEPEKSGHKCLDCNSDLLKKTGKYGPFLGCSNFPTCTSIFIEKDGELKSKKKS